MKIKEYETEKVIEIKGENENLEKLKNIISKLINDSSSKIATDLLASSKNIYEMTLDEFEKYLLAEFGIKNEIRADALSVIPKQSSLFLNISTNEKIDKFILKLCQKFIINATIVVNGFNENDDDPFELLTEVTNCSIDGTSESTVMQYEEYLYRYDSGEFWHNYMDELLHGGLEKETYDEFIRYFGFFNENDIQFIEGKVGLFKK